MTKDDRTIPDADDAEPTHVMTAIRQNDTRPLGTLVVEQPAGAGPVRQHAEQPPASRSPEADEPKKKFEPARFAAHTMPPELRKELSEMTLPNADPARLYWARMVEEPTDPADGAADQNGSLIPVDQPTFAVRDSRNETTERLPRRQEPRIKLQTLGIAALALGAVLVVAIVAFTGHDERDQQAAAPATSHPATLETSTAPQTDKISATSAATGQAQLPASKASTVEAEVRLPSAPSKSLSPSPSRPASDVSKPEAKVRTSNVAAGGTPSSRPAAPQSAPKPSSGPDLLTPLFPVPQKQP